MTLAILLAVVCAWTLVCIGCVALCRLAAQGDRLGAAARLTPAHPQERPRRDLSRPGQPR